MWLRDGEEVGGGGQVWRWIKTRLMNGSVSVRHVACEFILLLDDWWSDLALRNHTVAKKT